MRAKLAATVNALARARQKIKALHVRHERLRRRIIAAGGGESRLFVAEVRRIDEQTREITTREHARVVLYRKRA